MASLLLSVTVLLAVCYMSQSLRCHRCEDISENPHCKNTVEMECRPSQTRCLNMVLQPPAYGVVRRCVSESYCDNYKNSTEKHVIAKCCDTDLCN